MPTRKIIARAARLAALAHAGQTRKFSGEPYIVHPAEVARLVAAAGLDDEVVAAAWLHDTVEDTPVTLHQLRACFGERVAALVEQVTKSAPPGCGHQERESVELRRLAAACAAAQSIKCADITHNISDIVEHGGESARAYLAEKFQQLQVMTGAHPGLRQLALYRHRAASRELKEFSHPRREHALKTAL